MCHSSRNRLQRKKCATLNGTQHQQSYIYSRNVRLQLFMGSSWVCLVWRKTVSKKVSFKFSMFGWSKFLENIFSKENKFLRNDENDLPNRSTEDKFHTSHSTSIVSSPPFNTLHHHSPSPLTYTPPYLQLQQFCLDYTRILKKIIFYLCTKYKKICTKITYFPSYKPSRCLACSY